jgi:hypothetical protein
MNFTELRVAGAWIIDPSLHFDDRSRFMRAWCASEFEERGIHFFATQGNMHFSPRKGTVRGLHLQIAPDESFKSGEQAAEKALGGMHRLVRNGVAAGERAQLGAATRRSGAAHGLAPRGGCK